MAVLVAISFADACEKSRSAPLDQSCGKKRPEVFPLICYFVRLRYKSIVLYPSARTVSISSSRFSCVSFLLALYT
jgi:hypothetical protein